MASLYFEEQKRQTNQDEDDDHEGALAAVGMGNEEVPYDEPQDEQEHLVEQAAEVEHTATEAAPPPPSWNNSNNNDTDGSLVGVEPNVAERSFMKQNNNLPQTSAAPTPVDLPKPAVGGQQQQQQHLQQLSAQQRLHQQPQQQQQQQQPQQRTTLYRRVEVPSTPQPFDEAREDGVMQADVHLVGPATVTPSSADANSPFSSPNGGNDKEQETTEPDGNEDKPIAGKDLTNASIPNTREIDGGRGGGKSCGIAMIFAVLCCIISLAGIGVVVGLVLSNRNDSDGGADSVTGAGDTPSFPNTTPPTSPPPSNPVPAPATDVVNDECSGAIGLSNNYAQFISSSVDGTTAGEVDTEIETSCGGRIGDGAGLWYYIDGEGYEITASTCGEATEFDTKLSIFTGDCADLGSLSCVADDDDSCGIASAVTWVAERGVRYFILIRGFRQSSGTFILTVSEPPPPNDLCPGAIQIEADGTIHVGSTGPATMDSSYDSVCAEFDQLAITAPGVWFYMNATTSGELIATTCHATLYDTKISVFRGPDCDSLVCVGGDDDEGCSSFASQFKFPAVAGELYWVLVHGFMEESGEFGLSIASEDNLYNNFCWEAQDLQPGVPVIGDTTLAQFDFASAVECGDTIIVGPSLWFTVFGTGADMLVSLCNDATDYDTSVTVFSGDCSSLLCVGGNDDSPDTLCGTTSEFQWSSQLFEQYRIVVHGYGNSTGSFELVVDSLGDPPVLDNCGKALGPLPMNWNPVIGSTSTIATVPESVFDCSVGLDNTTVPGEWYYVMSDGGQLNVSICEDLSPGIRLAVFQGGESDDCSLLTCDSLVGTEYGDSCAFAWDTTRGTSYHVFVYSPPDTVAGEYGLTVTSTGPPPVSNDSCEEAIQLEINSLLPSLGTTAGATLEELVATCGEQITSPTAWHTVTGDGTVLTASLCSPETNFDTQLSVFVGSGCGDLVCLGSNDDFCDLQSSYSWVSEPMERYFILVHGFSDSTGDYGISIVSTEA